MYVFILWQKTAVAVALCKKGRGLIKVNGQPIELIRPEALRFKVFEPILLLGRSKFAGIDIRVKVRGGGYIAQIYGIVFLKLESFIKNILMFWYSCPSGHRQGNRCLLR